MDELIEQLQNKYYDMISDIKVTGKAEITLTVEGGTGAAHFSQELQDHVVGIIDELTIIKINIVDRQGALIDSFATNQ